MITRKASACYTAIENLFKILKYPTYNFISIAEENQTCQLTPRQKSLYYIHLTHIIYPSPKKKTTAKDIVGFYFIKRYSMSI